MQSKQITNQIEENIYIMKAICILHCSNVERLYSLLVQNTMKNKFLFSLLLNRVVTIFYYHTRQCEFQITYGCSSGSRKSVH